MTKWIKHKIYEYRKRFGKLVDSAEKTIPEATQLKKRCCERVMNRHRE